MNEDEVTWRAECTVCCWASSTGTEYRAEDRADAHTEDTGHKTIVEEDK